MNKFWSIILPVTVAAVVLIGLKVSSAKKSFEYFYIHCSVFKRDGTLIYTVPNNFNMCAFKSDGSVLAAVADSTLALLDKNDQEIWREDSANAHHDIRFTKDEKSILLITSETVPFGPYVVRSDCFEKRDLAYNSLKRWCLKDHLPELNELGFYIYRLGETSIAKSNASVAFEISHANSIQEIGENKRAGFDHAFQPGNFLVHLNQPICALLILDRDFNKILWHKNYCRVSPQMLVQSISTHDNQITDEGHVLTYVNFVTEGHAFRVETEGLYEVFNPVAAYFRAVRAKNDFKSQFQFKGGLGLRWPEDLDWYSKLVEYDPYTEQIYWQYQDTPAGHFKAGLVGSVTALPNGNYLYSDITRAGEAFEIDRDGKKVWSFSYPVLDKNGKPLVFDRIKPFQDLSFLRARNLLDD